MSLQGAVVQERGHVVPAASDRPQLVRRGASWEGRHIPCQLCRGTHPHCLSCLKTTSTLCYARVCVCACECVSKKKVH